MSNNSKQAASARSESGPAAGANWAYKVLSAAQNLIRDPAHWTKGAYARNELGDRVGPHDPSAVCWCFAGAVIRCGGGRRIGGLADPITDLFRGEPAGLRPHQR